MDRSVVRSIKNPILQRARAALAGRGEDLVALEGDRLVADARATGLSFDAILVAEDRGDTVDELDAVGLPVVVVARDLFGRISRLATSPGILALVRTPSSARLERLVAVPRPRVLVVCGLQNPGNLGALARSAEAAGASGIAIVAGGASPWNEKALRGSMGSLLRLPVHTSDDAAALARSLAEHGLRHVVCATRGGTPLERFDFRGPIALWIGAETGSLPAIAGGFEAVTIPMRGRVESLNAAVAGSLLLFAAQRAEDRE